MLQKLLLFICTGLRSSSGHFLSWSFVLCVCLSFSVDFPLCNLASSESYRSYTGFCAVDRPRSFLEILVTQFLPNSTPVFYKSMVSVGWLAILVDFGIFVVFLLGFGFWVIFLGGFKSITFTPLIDSVTPYFPE